ncbi:MAG: hypothetical protein OXT09_15600 [Myxococcales bacterium]|nr:hypothetical protein [Myxococcales bacterium]
MPRRNSRGRTAAYDDIGAGAHHDASRDKQYRRKDYQLCGQVQRALAEALAADFGDEVLNRLWVAHVEPAPTVRRMLVWVAAPPETPAELVLERLAAVKDALRAEVGAAIHRKRTPFLLFAIHDAGDPGQYDAD